MKKTVAAGLLALSTVFSTGAEPSAQQNPAPEPTEINAPKANPNSTSATTAEFTANADSVVHGEGNESKGKTPASVARGSHVEARDASRDGTLALYVSGGTKENDYSAWQYANMLRQILQDSGVSNDIIVKYADAKETAPAEASAVVGLYIYGREYKENGEDKLFFPSELVDHIPPLREWVATKRRENGDLAYTAPTGP